jgi:hypothetical protein
VCTSSRKALIGRQALYNHNYKKHESGSKRKLLSVTGNVANSVPEFTISDMECIGGTERTTNNVLVEPLSNCHSSSHEFIKYALLDTPNFYCFSTLENQLYFKHHYMEEGPSLLVARSQDFVTDLVQKIEKTEVCFHVGMASLLFTLT